MLEEGMVAPFGPLNGEALTLTLDKPPVGACTTTCVSTVSPRAPERLMEEVLPGGSVCPARTRLDCTHTGKDALAGVSPTPLKPIVAGELVALLAIDMLPAALPATAGA